MTTQAPPTVTATLETHVGVEPARRRRYILAAIAGNVLTWAAAISVMLWVPRVYTVESSLILPSSDPDARVDLKDVGQAYATTRATYDAKSLDPRVNYKEIMLSADVIDAAAKSLKMDPAKFGQPAVKLIDQSSIMALKMKASTPELALAKAIALQEAFSQRVGSLRKDEIQQRQRAIEQAIQASLEKLEAARRELVRFKVSSQIVTEKQLEETALLSTTLHSRYMELDQRLAHDRAVVSSLAEQLGLPPNLAGWTLTLQGDAVFMEHFRQFATASSSLGDYSHKWDEGHPKVREANGTQASAMNAMLTRAKVALGVPVSRLDLRRMTFVLQDRSRDQLLRELVAAQASADSAVAELHQVNRQRFQMADQLPKLASESAQLDELQRRVAFAEAVFTGAVGKTDVGIANVFSSYPMVQTLVAPSRPLTPSFPKASYVGAGACMASLLLTSGLALSWLRRKS